MQQKQSRFIRLGVATLGLSATLGSATVGRADPDGFVIPGRPARTVPPPVQGQGRQAPGASPTAAAPRGAPASSAKVAAAACNDVDHMHSAWSAFLVKYNRGGVVQYGEIKRVGIDELDGYLRQLERACPEAAMRWPMPQRMAFWINAYNAYAIKLVVDHYPLRSVRSIGILAGAAFREQLVPLGPLAGAAGKGRSKLSLNDIEHEVLHALGDPRTHFALVSASKGAPVLRSMAYRAVDLTRALDDAARAFVRDPAKNRFDVADGTLYLSSIFKWSEEDFKKASGSLTSFVVKYMDPTVAPSVAKAAVHVQFLDYDWALNGT